MAELLDLLNCLQFRWLRLDGSTKADLRPQLVANFKAERQRVLRIPPLDARAGSA
jgi:SNF2 family DNA or RNA helicase